MRVHAHSALLGIGLALLLAAPASAVIGDCNGSRQVEITDLITACVEREFAGGAAYVDGASLGSDFSFAVHAPR